MIYNATYFTSANFHSLLPIDLVSEVFASQNLKQRTNEKTNRKKIYKTQKIFLMIVS